MQSYLKVFFNVVEGMNPEILSLMEEMNKTYLVTPEELEVSLKVRY